VAAAVQDLLLEVATDVVDRLLHRRDLFRFLVRDLRLEFFFERHHQFDGIEGVGAEVIDERRLVLDVRFGYAELLRDDLLDALFHVVHCSPPREGSPSQNRSILPDRVRFNSAAKFEPGGRIEPDPNWVTPCTCRR
jgi:hypothetical protein